MSDFCSDTVWKISYSNSNEFSVFLDVIFLNIPFQWNYADENNNK